MNTRIKKEIETLAKANPDKEVCGFIYHTLDEVSIMVCANIALDPSKDFEISADDYLNCLNKGKILYVFHSHPLSVETGAAFTSIDLEVADEMQVPWLVYSVREDAWAEYFPKGYELPLEGEVFIWGIKDCYSTVRNYYRQVRGIYLKDYDRDETYPQSSGDIILKNFEKEGFYDVGSISLLKKDDVLLFLSGKALPQHFAVFLGNSRILHHPLHALSRKEILTQRWTSRLTHVLRYKDKIT